MEKRKEHPAYGLLMFTRVQGGSPCLFGSSVKHNHRIKIGLYHGIEKEGMAGASRIQGGCIAEAEMSLNQFAEAITSIGTYPGIPVTLKYTEKDADIPEIDAVSNKRSQYVEEFGRRMKEASGLARGLVSDAEEMLQKKNLTKKDREELLDALRRISNAVGGNAAFMAELFDEAVEKIVVEAKSEVEAYVSQKMNSLAYAAMQEGIQEKDPETRPEIPVIFPEEGHKEDADG